MAFLNALRPRAKMDCCNRPWTLRLGGFVRATQRPALYARQNAMARMLITVANLCGSVIWVSSNPKPRVFRQENSVSMPQRLRYMGSAVLILILLVATINISPVYKRIMAILIGVVCFSGSRPRYHGPFRMRCWRFLRCLAWADNFTGTSPSFQINMFYFRRRTKGMPCLYSQCIHVSPINSRSPLKEAMG